MFDSLRRAEAARRKKQTAEAREPDRPTLGPVAFPVVENDAAGPEQLEGFPDGYLRELGILKNSIDASLGGSGKKTLLFTSSTTGEGTTTLVSSYARLLSIQTRERVLLVEMNARRPSMYHRFGLQSGAGVTHFFTGTSTFDAIVQRPPKSAFDVVVVGEKDPTKIQLHLERMLPRLLEAARQRYDTVLIDAPPVIGSPETPPLASFVDGVVVLVRCGKTKREIVQRSLNMIAQFEGNVIGVVLNRKKYYIPDFIYRRI